MYIKKGINGPAYKEVKRQLYFNVDRRSRPVSQVALVSVSDEEMPDPAPFRGVQSLEPVRHVLKSSPSRYPIERMEEARLEFPCGLFKTRAFTTIVFVGSEFGDYGLNGYGSGQKLLALDNWVGQLIEDAVEFEQVAARSS